MLHFPFLDFWMTLAFDPQGKSMWKIILPSLLEWLTELSKKQRRGKQLPGETVWLLIEKLLEVRPDVCDMPEIAYGHCQTFQSKTQCCAIGGIFKQFSTFFLQSSCDTIQISQWMKESLRLMVTSLGHQKSLAQFTVEVLASEKQNKTYEEKEKTLLIPSA